jgi:hypothetical protein
VKCDNFTVTKLDKVSWLPGNYGTGAILKQSGGRLNFSMPSAKAKEVDIWLELLASRPSYNENSRPSLMWPKPTALRQLVNEPLDFQLQRL